jgi:hypothetical protein
VTINGVSSNITVFGVSSFVNNSSNKTLFFWEPPLLLSAFPKTSLSSSNTEALVFKS